MFRAQESVHFKGEQPIIVEDVEETILRRLKNQEVEATIPQM